MTTIIYVCGAYTLVFALFHLGFWKMFGWGGDLKNLSDIEKFDADRRIMHILNIQMVWCFVAVAAICFMFPAELAGTQLGNAFLAGCSIFWLIRAIVQPIYLRGGLLSTLVFVVVFLAGAVLFAVPAVNGLF